VVLLWMQKPLQACPHAQGRATFYMFKGD